MYQKYVQAVPLYRQETQWKDAGIAFSRTTMANWVIRCSQDWLSLVYDRMRKELLGREVLHADETPVQVLKGTGKTAANKSYMWVYRTGKDGLPPVVLFEYQPGRSGEYPKKFLEGFTRYLHTDGYAGYNKVERITRCGCWAHLRRKFVDAMPSAFADLVGPPSSAQVGRDYCDQLFAAEKEIELLPGKDQQRVRLEVETPMLRAFWCWLEKLAEQPVFASHCKGADASCVFPLCAAAWMARSQFPSRTAIACCSISLLPFPRDFLDSYKKSHLFSEKVSHAWADGARTRFHWALTMRVNSN